VFLDFLDHLVSGIGPVLLSLLEAEVTLMGLGLLHGVLSLPADIDAFVSLESRLAHSSYFFRFLELFLDLIQGDPVVGPLRHQPILESGFLYRGQGAGGGDFDLEGDVLLFFLF
jgi:hypothetical protein